MPPKCESRTAVQRPDLFEGSELQRHRLGEIPRRSRVGVNSKRRVTKRNKVAIFAKAEPEEGPLIILDHRCKNRKRRARPTTEKDANYLECPNAYACENRAGE